MGWAPRIRAPAHRASRLLTGGSPNARRTRAHGEHLQDALGNRRLGHILAKRTAGPSTSPCEAAADRAAARALDPAAPAPGSELDAGCCDACDAGVQAELDTEHAGGSTNAEVPPLAGAGAPIPTPFRGAMESRFGARFGGVRVHTDSSAGASARALGARAYTQGSHVVFAPGEYAPDTPSGRELIAHELAHVVQQGAAHSDSTTPSEGGVIQRQADAGADDADPQVQVISIPVEYSAYADDDDPSVGLLPSGAFTGAGQAVGYWTSPIASGRPWSALQPEWLRRRAWSSTLGEQSSGELLLERYAGRTTFDPKIGARSRIVEFFGTGLGDELAPRSTIMNERLPWLEQVCSVQAPAKALTRDEALRLGDILERRASGASFSQAEATAAEALIEKAALLHAESGITAGSPFLSATAKPGLSTILDTTKRRFLSGRPYVVQVRVQPGATVAVNKLPGRSPHLLGEEEFLVTEDLNGRVVAVQPNPTSSLAKAEPYMRWGGRALMAYGLYSSVDRIMSAPPEERDRVIAQEAGGQAGGFGGSVAGAAACAAAGLATGGVGLFLCGLGGGWAGAKAGAYLADLPFALSEAAAQIPQAMRELQTGVEVAGGVVRQVEEAMFIAPVLRGHALMDPGNWDLRWLPPDVARDLAAVGLAVWERLGPLDADGFLGEIGKPLGEFGVPVDAAQRLAEYLSGPDQTYYAQNPTLYASLGDGPAPEPALAGTNILEMKSYELIEKLSARKMAFVQDPNYLAGYATELEESPAMEISLRQLIGARMMLDADRWSFPGKRHEQFAPVQNMGNAVWAKLRVLDQQDFNARYNTKLGDFGFPDWYFTYAAGAFDADTSDLTEDEKVLRTQAVEELAQALREMTPQDFAYFVMAQLSMEYLPDPNGGVDAAIERMRHGMQPW